MQNGPGSRRSPHEDEVPDSLTYYEQELARTIDDSIRDTLDDEEERDQEEAKDECLD